MDKCFFVVFLDKGGILRRQREVKFLQMANEKCAEINDEKKAQQNRKKN